MRSIAIVIVTYNNIKMLEGLLSDLSRQTRRPDVVFIIDNASRDATKEVILSKYPLMRYIRLPENTGSAGGFCLGLQQALNENCDFVLTLDDDVQLDDNTIEELEKGFERLAPRSKVGAVRSVGQQPAPADDQKFDLMTWRGMFFDAKAVKEAGFPKPEFFIYGEDLEYSFRFLKRGYSFYWINSSKCSNPRTAGQKVVFLFGKKLKYYTDPFRLYYAFRNELSIFIEYGHFVKAFKVLFYSIRVILSIVLFEPRDRALKIKAIGTGLWHGLIKKLGKNKQYTPD